MNLIWFLHRSKLIKIDHKPTDHKAKKGKNLHRCSGKDLYTKRSIYFFRKREVSIKSW